MTLPDHLTAVLQQLLASLAHLQQVEQRVTADVSQVLAPRVPQPRMQGSLRILPETTPRSILEWVWPQIPLAQRIAFLLEHLTVQEQRTLLDAPQPFLYHHGQHVQLPHHGGVGTIVLLRLTRRQLFGDIVEYAVECPDGEVVWQVEADLTPVEDEPCGS